MNFSLTLLIALIIPFSASAEFWVDLRGQTLSFDETLYIYENPDTKEIGQLTKDLDAQAFSDTNAKNDHLFVNFCSIKRWTWPGNNIQKLPHLIFRGARTFKFEDVIETLTSRSWIFNYGSHQLAIKCGNQVRSCSSGRCLKKIGLTWSRHLELTTTMGAGVWNYRWK